MTLRRSTTLLAGAAALVVTALAVVGCGGGSDTATPTTASGSPATIGVANEGDLGKILVDSQGRTLYLFQKDSGTKSACTGECADNWPPLQANGKPTEGSGADASLVATTSGPTETRKSPTTATRSTSSRATRRPATRTARA